MEVLKYEKSTGNINNNHNELENVINLFQYNDKTNHFLATYYYNNKRYIFEICILEICINSELFASASAD